MGYFPSLSKSFQSLDPAPSPTVRLNRATNSRLLVREQKTGLPSHVTPLPILDKPGCDLDGCKYRHALSGLLLLDGRHANGHVSLVTTPRTHDSDRCGCHRHSPPKRFCPSRVQRQSLLPSRHLPPGSAVAPPGLPVLHFPPAHRRGYCQSSLHCLRCSVTTTAKRFEPPGNWHPVHAHSRPSHLLPQIDQRGAARHYKYRYPQTRQDYLRWAYACAWYRHPSPLPHLNGARVAVARGG